MKTIKLLFGRWYTQLLFLFLFPFYLSAQTSINDNFSTSNSSWQSVNLSGTGSFNVSGGSMNLTANANSTFGVYNTQVLTGHFYIEVDFAVDDNVGLALFNRMANGAPDLNNYSLIKVENVNGTTEISINDKQNGIADVWDNTGWAANKATRYKNTLNSSTYSLPYASTNKKLRIFRHANEKFIHFSYAVKKNVDGQDATGWIELAPSKEWTQLSGNFLMGLVAINGNATFDNAIAINKPTQDQNDSNTGFAATWREVNWSGYFGNALVVSFNAANAPLTGGTRKFIFWEAFNSVPAWYLDESVMYTYEFVETWGGGSLGAHEPMSDRLRRFSKVTLDYDGSDYKIVHWEYVLHDADYKWPAFGQGTQKPIVDEWYKIYPDGTILRKIRYKAKLDATFRNWHELTELIVVTGNNTDPGEHLANPSLSIWPLGGQRQDFVPLGAGNNYEQSNNDATLMAVHMKNHPDLVNAFNDNAAYSGTYPGDPITIYKTWHDQTYHMSHWPINKEQYYTDPFKSVTTWKEQVKHTSLAGAGAYLNNSQEWTSNFQTDPVDGRKYREWTSFMSLSPQGNLSQAKANVETWRANPWNWTGPQTPQVNVALNKPTVSSSNQNSSNVSGNAVDGNINTRWESQGTNTEWIYVDLGQNHNISRVLIEWEAAYSSVYSIQVSNNATSWTTVHQDNQANGGTDNIILSNVSGRYVRILGTARATQYGHSIFELEVYGTVANATTYNIVASAGSNGTISPTGTVSVNQGSNQTFTITPNAGFAISGVLVNGVSQGAISTYTFSNVTSNHSISATFSALPVGCSTTINSSNFDANWGSWLDGGTDALRVTNAAYAFSGSTSALIRDNTSTSVISTGNMDLTGYSSIDVSFTFITNSMDAGEDFWLQLSTNGGTSYTTVRTYVSGTHFTNGTRVFQTVNIPGPFTTNTRLRFRNDATDDDDQVYLDDVVVKGCISGARISAIEENTMDSGLVLYPNPVMNGGKLNIQLSGFQNAVGLEVYDTSGRKAFDTTVSDQTVYTIDVSGYNKGVYLLRVNNAGVIKSKKFIIE